MRKLRIEIDLEALDRDHPVEHQVVGWIGHALRQYAAGIEVLQHVPHGRVPLRGWGNKVVGSAWVEETEPAPAVN